MAAPITHIVFSEKIFISQFKDKNIKDFSIGTLFPDIRYLKSLNRNITHFENVKFENLKNEGSFQAGLKFHSLFDYVRERYLIENEIYLLCPASKSIKQSLKLYEDIILYAEIINWKNYVNYLNDILKEEEKFNIKHSIIVRWHKILQEYIICQPNVKSITSFMLLAGFNPADVNEIIKTISKMINNKELINKIISFYTNFDEILLLY